MPEYSDPKISGSAKSGASLQKSFLYLPCLFYTKAHAPLPPPKISCLKSLTSKLASQGSNERETCENFSFYGFEQKHQFAY